MSFDSREHSQKRQTSPIYNENRQSFRPVEPRRHSYFHGLQLGLPTHSYQRLGVGQKYGAAQICYGRCCAQTWSFPAGHPFPYGKSLRFRFVPSSTSLNAQITPLKADEILMKRMFRDFKGIFWRTKGFSQERWTKLPGRNFSRELSN